MGGAHLPWWALSISRPLHQRGDRSEGLRQVSHHVHLASVLGPWSSWRAVRSLNRAAVEAGRLDMLNFPSEEAGSSR
jgi:hypothetical protein